jgi:hypothetical protein
MSKWHIDRLRLASRKHPPSARRSQAVHSGATQGINYFEGPLKL